MKTKKEIEKKLIRINKGIENNRKIYRDVKLSFFKTDELDNDLYELKLKKRLIEWVLI